MEKYPLVVMHSSYHHLHRFWGDGGIPFYNDKKVFEDTPPGAMALLIEPRSLLPDVYEYIEKNYNKFIYVFTHDSILLKKIPNAKLIIWGGVWDWSDMEKDFSHPISMVASEKGTSAVRIARRNLAFELNNKIDTYGTFNGGPRVDTKTIYNCIPIYYGARKVDSLFDGDGIIHANSIDDIRKSVDELLVNGEAEYKKRINAIRNNRKIVEKYKHFDLWFMDHYGEMLGKTYEAIDYYSVL